jgi:hypothetical protein
MANAEVTIPFADGQYKFRLALGELRELQEKTNAGPLELLKRLHAGTWRVDDPRETIRLGLIGGGMLPTEAMKLVLRYVDARPLTENVMTAQAILMVALYEEEDPQMGKDEPRRSESTESSPSRESTEQVH